jgi:DNA-binding response OmpR family regulator
MLLRHVISAADVELFEAESAEDALTCAARQAPFDLVVTDIVMPGMDGVDLAHRLRAEGCAQRFLFVSGFCDRQSLEHRIAGLDARFLAKPFAIPELASLVRSILDDPRTKRRSRRASH